MFLQPCPRRRSRTPSPGPRQPDLPVPWAARVRSRAAHRAARQGRRRRARAQRVAPRALAVRFGRGEHRGCRASRAVDGLTVDGVTASGHVGDAKPLATKPCDPHTKAARSQRRRGPRFRRRSVPRRARGEPSSPAPAGRRRRGPSACARRRATGRAPGRHAAAVAEHGHQRNDARPAADQQERALDAPDEVAADRPPQLDRIARHELTDQIREDLSVHEPLDGQLDVVGRERGRGDRVRALRRLVSGAVSRTS